MQAKPSLEWTPDLKTKVKTWFLDNRKSYTWIRGQLKSEGYGEVSRSAVAGVLNRMGVARHGGKTAKTGLAPAPKKPRPKSTYERRPALKSAVKQEVPMPVLKDTDGPPLHNKPMMELYPDECRWPTYMDGKIQMCCAGPVWQRTSYCAYHGRVSERKFEARPVVPDTKYKPRVSRFSL